MEARHFCGTKKGAVDTYILVHDKPRCALAAERKVKTVVAALATAP